MKNEGLNDEIQELGALRDNMALSLSFPPL